MQTLGRVVRRAQLRDFTRAPSDAFARTNFSTRKSSVYCVQRMMSTAATIPSPNSTASNVAQTKTHATQAPKTNNQQSFGAMLVEKTERFEHRDSLVVPHENYRGTYLELQDKVDAYANGLLQLRIKPGDVIVSAISDTNSLYHICASLAALRIGATFVPVPTDTSAQSLLNIVNELKASSLIIHDEIGDRSLINEFNEAVPELDIMDWLTPELVVIRKMSFLRVIFHTGESAWAGMAMIKNLPVWPVPSPLVKLTPKISHDQKAFSFPTGSVGESPESKTALNTVNQSTIIQMGRGILESVNAKVGDRVAICAPLGLPSTYALLAGCIEQGVVAIFPSNGFNADAALSAIYRDKATILYIKPEDLPAVFAHKRLPKSDLSSLRRVILVGKADGNTTSQIKEVLKAEVHSIESSAKN